MEPFHTVKVNIISSEPVISLHRERFWYCWEKAQTNASSSSRHLAQNKHILSPWFYHLSVILPHSLQGLTWSDFPEMYVYVNRSTNRNNHINIVHLFFWISTNSYPLYYRLFYLKAPSLLCCKSSFFFLIAIWYLGHSYTIIMCYLCDVMLNFNLTFCFIFYIFNISI